MVSQQIGLDMGLPFICHFYQAISATDSVQEDFLPFYEQKKVLQMCVPLAQMVSVLCRKYCTIYFTGALWYSNFHKHSPIT